MKNKKNLFFDFDDMKFITLPLLVSYINKKYGIKTTLNEYLDNNDSLDKIIQEHLPGVLIGYNDIYKDVGENFHASLNWHSDVEPMPHMSEVMKGLKEKYNLYTVTSRQKVGIGVIQYILDKYIPGCITGVHCVWHYDKTDGFIANPKRNFIENTPGENIAFFDDSPKEIKKVEDIIPSYLFDPNGLHKDSETKNRVASWEQIGNMFL
jgi:hypothetical protein